VSDVGSNVSKLEPVFRHLDDFLIPRSSYRHGLKTFGNDGWPIEQQWRLHALVGLKLGPGTRNRPTCGASDPANGGTPRWILEGVGRVGSS